MKHLIGAMGLAALSACNMSSDAENNAPAVVQGDANLAATLLDKMQGRWISDDDPENVISIEGDNLATIYSGQPLGDEKIVIVRDCSEMLADQNGMSFTLSDDGPDLRCFNILSVSEEKLVYSYMPRGNTLSYTRSGN